MTAPHDPVHHPAHYTTGAVECIDAIAASMSVHEFRGYCKGNALKYLWRYAEKAGLQDVQKAQWYLTKLLTTFSPETSTDAIIQGLPAGLRAGVRDAESTR